jgi:hypothetical protein
VKIPCLHVTGTIDEIRTEADGDLHILLRLDSPYVGYLTSANYGVELGDLVVEPVCVRPVSQADAIAVCASDPDPLTLLPIVGLHVWIEGRYVLDSEHGGWAELHPLYRWSEIQAASPSPTASPTPSPTMTAAPSPTASPSPTAGTGVYGNPWGYDFNPGNPIYGPPSTFCSYFPCIPSFWTSTSGYVVQCVDLLFSHSGGRSGVCSYHGGYYRTLYSH